jgi:hypothetical protein
MIFGIFDWFKRKSEPKELPEEEYMEEPVREQHFEIPASRPRVEGVLKFVDNKIIYEVEVTNTTSEIMGGLNIMVEPARANIIGIKDAERSAELLDPDKSQKFEFEIQPMMRCGKTVIHGTLEYFDFDIKERRQIKVPNKMVILIPPDTKGIKIDEDSWRMYTNRNKHVEVETKPFQATPDSFFREFSKIIEEQNLYMLDPVITPNIYRGISRYFGLDREGSKYAVEFQLIGNLDESKFLLRSWGPNPERCIALCCKIIDEFDKISDIEIKNYIKN